MPEHSVYQTRYLLRQQRRRQFIHLSRLFLAVAFSILWETAADLGWIDSFFFGSPSRIGRLFIKMISDGTLALHVGTTLFETLVSFFLTVLLGVGIAVLLWVSSTMAEILEPCLVILNSLPKSALAPLLIVWLGANMRTIVVAGICVAIFGTILNLYTGFKETDPEKLKLTLHPSRDQKGCPVSCGSAFHGSSYDQHFKGQHRTVPGGSNYWRIYWSQAGTRGI